MLPWIRVPLLVLMVAALAGCESDTPTTPGGPVPEISRVEPADVTPGASPQVLTVSGQGFTTGLTVLLTPPNGARTSISGDAIQGLNSVSFQVAATFDTPGQYRLAVRLVNGSESNEVQLTASLPAGAVPHVDTVTPAGVQPSANPTIVTLTGSNFSSGSRVNLTLPDGTTTPLPASAIMSATATTMQLSIVFATAGTYALSVANAQGEASNVVTITAF